MVNLILVCVAIAIFLAYNIAFICKFGFIWSLSNSYYYYEGVKKGLGSLFTIMMFAVSLLLMPAWIDITERITEWSHYLTFLPFLGAASITFVGAAPNFRSCKMENIVHMVAAGCAAAFSLIWVAVVCYKIAWLIPLWVLIIGGLAHLTKSHKTATDYWVEMIAFGATFSAILIEAILLL